MNILFFHRWTGVRGGGTETHLKALLRNLPSEHGLHLLTRNGPNISFLKKEYPHVEIFTVSKNLFESDNSYENPLLLYAHTLTYMIKAFFKLVYLTQIKKIKFDVMSVHFATEAIVANIIRKLFNIPYVFILEGYTDWEAKVSKEANEAISISHYISKKCQKNFEHYPDVIYIGESNFPFILEENIYKKRDNKPKRVLTLCRFEPRKNLSTAVKTVSYIVNKLKRKDIEFVFGGTGILEEQIRQEARKHKVDKHIKFLGFVPDSAVVKLYQSSHIYFLPTFEEGFGIVYTEAMKSGAVIISTNKTATPEIVGEAGFLIDDALDYKGFAQKIIKLVDDENLWADSAQRGLERAKLFTWEKLIPEYEKKYLNAAKKA